jgi:hypothetical protein
VSTRAICAFPPFSVLLLHRRLPLACRAAFSPFCRSPSRPARSGSINGSQHKEARTHPIPLEGHAHAVLEEKTTSLAITTGLLDDSRVPTPRLASDRLTSRTSGISAHTRIGRGKRLLPFACKSCSLISTNLFRAQIILSVKRLAPHQPDEIDDRISFLDPLSAPAGHSKHSLRNFWLVFRPRLGCTSLFTPSLLVFPSTRGHSSRARVLVPTLSEEDLCIRSRSSCSVWRF